MQCWKRERPLYIVPDNYSVHVGQAVRDALPTLEAADVHLFYLPSYSPELSELEPIWNAVKHHEMSVRSYSQVKELIGPFPAMIGGDHALGGEC